MDTRDGSIHMMKDGETLDMMEKRLGARPGDIVALGKLPDRVCRRCGGTGRERAGLSSNRFKPCRCTFDISNKR